MSMGMNAQNMVLPEGVKDFTLEGGCFLCGGDLAVRVGPDGTGSCCVHCAWISRPHLVQDGKRVQVAHPAGGVA
jgi:hypothetical protein